MSLENKKEKRYVKNSVDYISYGPVEEDCRKADQEKNDCENVNHEIIECEKTDGLKDNDGLNEFEEFGDIGFQDCLDLLDDCELGESNLGDSCKNPKDSNPDDFSHSFIDENPDELAMLGFFKEFTLVDIGLHDFIREIYFED